MSLFLLTLVSCQQLVSGSTPKPMTVPEVPNVEPVVRELALPAGQAIVRECYAGADRETRRWTPRPAPTPTKAMPSAASRGRSAMDDAKGPTGGALAPEPMAAAAPSAAPMTTVPDVSSNSPAQGQSMSGDQVGTVSGSAGLGASTGGKGEGYAETKNKKADAPVQMQKQQLDKEVDAPKASSTTARSESKPMRVMEQPEAARPMDLGTRNLDWGAKVYLSNDDSMSLASAQRLLWAVQNRGPVKASEIRPHELLNYFSFDTAPVDAGDLFSVQASAEQTGSDQLTLAFAVHGTTPARDPLDLTMVLDRSGSMAADGRMTYLKRGLHDMEGQLKRGDRVDLVLFDNEVCTPLENYVVGRDDPSLLTAAIDAIQPRGSTNLDAGLKEGYRAATSRSDTDGRNRRLLLITDALLNEGNVDPDLVSEIGKQYESSHIRLSAVGVGREFNDKVLDKLTEKGKGAYVYLGSEAVVDRVFGPMFDSLTHTIAHDVHFALQLPPSLAMTKFYGEEASTNKEDVQPIHYFAGTTQLFLQDVAMRGSSPVAADPVTLTIEWSDVDTGATRTQEFTSTVGQLLAGDEHNLDKGRALMAWTDMIQARALGNDPCAAPFRAWQERVGRLGSDAEIGWLDSLTSPLCGITPNPAVASTSGVPYKVKVDADQVIAEVQLACGGRTLTQALSGSDTVARFDTASPGRGCQLTLVGTVPMQTTVTVPPSGGDIRCTVRGGRLSCG